MFLHEETKWQLEEKLGIFLREGMGNSFEKMFKSILVLNFSDECEAINAQSHHLMLLRSGIFPDAHFSSKTSRFLTGIPLFHLVDGGKREGHGTFRKTQNMNTSRPIAYY